MATQTVSVQESSSILVEGEKTSVFRQLRDFRSKVPKHVLAKWEEPTGFYTVVWVASTSDALSLGLIKGCLVTSHRTGELFSPATSYTFDILRGSPL